MSRRQTKCSGAGVRAGCGSPVTELVSVVEGCARFFLVSPLGHGGTWERETNDSQGPDLFLFSQIAQGGDLEIVSIDSWEIGGRDAGVRPARSYSWRSASIGSS